jgi:ABC-type dipeptide/oligopeptide/nickel transport system permease component
MGALVTLAVVSFITFVALQATPGDVVSGLVGDSASVAQLQTMRAQLGLDQSLPVQYAAFVSKAVRGDLGRSFISNKPVLDLLLERLPCTIVLALSAITLALIIGMTMGIAAALRAGTKTDLLLMSGAALGLAIPTFWSALVLMLIFSVNWRVLPLIGIDNPFGFVLPSITLALPTAAAIARLMRASLLDVLRSDYVRTANAKGLLPQRVLMHHVVRNSLLPVVTMLGLHLGHLLSGAFIVETIFALPGLGRLVVQAIFDRDYPIVLGATLFSAALYIVINFLVDLAHGWLDPHVAQEAI